MTPTTLTWMILQELDSHQKISSFHFENTEEVKTCLLEPFKADFSFFTGEVKSLWVVLDEVPNDKQSGYLIIFDEDEEMFGLGIKPSNENEAGYLIGLYGSFTDTLRNM
jgi:hypothetical protein